MADTPQTNPVAAVASPAERARDGLAQAIQACLAAEQKDLTQAVSAVMGLAAEIGHVRIGCRDDGAALTVRVGREPEQVVELPRARSLLRMMCANLAVRAARPDSLAPVYGGIAYLPSLQPGRPGFTLKLMNTMGEHWFDLAYQGETP